MRVSFKYLGSLKEAFTVIKFSVVGTKTILVCLLFFVILAKLEIDIFVRALIMFIIAVPFVVFFKQQKFSFFYLRIYKYLSLMIGGTSFLNYIVV